MYETLKVEREDHLTWLILNRPDQLNAMNRTLIRELGDFFWKLGEDRQTRVLIMRGAGRAFCLAAPDGSHGGQCDHAAADFGVGLRLITFTQFLPAFFALYTARSAALRRWAALVRGLPGS